MCTADSNERFALPRMAMCPITQILFFIFSKLHGDYFGSMSLKPSAAGSQGGSKQARTTSTIRLISSAQVSVELVAIVEVIKVHRLSLAFSSNNGHVQIDRLT